MAMAVRNGKRKFANGSIERVTKKSKYAVNIGVATGPLVTSSKATSLATPTTSSHGMLSRAQAKVLSQSAVFNTYELLENILVNLPVADILTARCVNKHWDSVITTSPKLRYQMCLTTKPIKTCWTCNMTTAIIRPTPTSQMLANKTRYLDGYNVYTVSTINDHLFLTNKSDAERGTLMHRAVYCESFSFKARPNLLLFATGKAGPMAKMFICQPPINEVVVIFQYGDKPAPGSRKRLTCPLYLKAQIKNIHGVTMGDLINGFLELAETEADAALREQVERARRRNAQATIGNQVGVINIAGPGGQQMQAQDDANLDKEGKNCVKQASQLVIDIRRTHVWVKRAIFPNPEELARVESSPGGFQPTVEEVKELKRLHAAKEGS